MADHFDNSYSEISDPTDIVGALAQQWVANYRQFVRREDLPARPTNVVALPMLSNGKDDPVRIDQLENDLGMFVARSLVDYRASSPELCAIFRENEVKNFGIHFCERIADVYDASSRAQRLATGSGDSDDFALIDIPDELQNAVIRSFAQEALDLAAFMRGQVPSIDLASMARYSPVVYADFMSLADHFENRLDHAENANEIARDFLASPRQTGINARLEQVPSHHPSRFQARNVPRNVKPELSILPGGGTGVDAGRTPATHIRPALVPDLPGR